MLFSLSFLNRSICFDFVLSRLVLPRVERKFALQEFKFNSFCLVFAQALKCLSLCLSCCHSLNCVLCDMKMCIQCSCFSSRGRTHCRTVLCTTSSSGKPVQKISRALHQNKCMKSFPKNRPFLYVHTDMFL